MIRPNSAVVEVDTKPAAELKPDAGGEAVGALPALAPPKPFLDSITFDFGPRDLLSSFFTTAETLSYQRGIRLAFAPMRDLVTVNRANQKSWTGLLPIFDPYVGGVTDDTGFCILGRNAVGEVVMTQAARLYRWGDTDMKREAESLRMFYADPARSARADEAYPVSAPSATAIRGYCVYSGAVWIRPDYRKRWLTSILPRISRAYAYTRWGSDLTFTLMAEAVLAGGTAERAGYRDIDWDVMLINSPFAKRLRMALLKIRRDEMLADIEQFMASADAQVDPVVLDRAG